MPSEKIVSPGDDDLEVILEQEPDSFGPSERVEIEPAHQAAQESSTVPIDDEEDVLGLRDDEPPAQQAADTSGGDAEVYDDRDERLAAAEEGIRRDKAQHIWDRAQDKAEVAETRIQGAKVGLNTIDERMGIMRSQIAAAVEAGDVATQMQLGEDMQRAQTLKSEIEAGLRQAPTGEQILAQGRQAAQQALSQAAQPRGKIVGAGLQSSNPLADRWAESNPWMRTNKAVNQYVISQSQKMAASGTWDPDSPSFYVELGKRIQLAYPAVKVNNIQARKQAPGRGQMRTQAAPSRSANGSGGNQQGQVGANGKRQFRVTPVEAAKMRRFKLDPGNEQHRKAWASSRMEGDRQRASQG